MTCLSDGDVLDFVQRQLSPLRMKEAEAHVDACATCRALVAEAVRSASVEVVETDENTAPRSSAELALTLPIGQVLQGRFRVEKLLGRGGMGVVYRAHDEKLDVRVALKVIAAQGRRAASLTARLLRELRLTRSITHPNVCRVFDVGEDGSQTFFTMELLEGETLEARAWRAPFDADDVVPILSQILGALEAAHKQNVVHRDLKPSNIMVSATGHVTVMDFGLAKDLSGVHTTTKDAVGTPAYWPPEQARGEGATAASDLFSFGLIAYRLFVRNLDAPFPSALDLEKIPAGYRSVLASCLELDKAKRASSAATVRNALLGNSERGPEPSPGSARWAFIGLAAMGIVTLGGGFATFAFTRATRVTGPASAEDATPPRTTLPAKIVASSTPSPSPASSSPPPSPLPSAAPSTTNIKAPSRAAPRPSSNAGQRRTEVPILN